MIQKLFFLILIILVACTPLTTKQAEQTSQEKAGLEEALQEKVEIEILIPVKTVTKIFDNKKTTFGFDENSNLLRAELPDKTFELSYENGKLTEIAETKNNSTKKIKYSGSKLAEISKNGKITRFEYENDCLKTAATEDSTLHLTFGSSGLLRQAIRDTAGKTSIDYYPDNKIKYITRGSVTLDVLYDDKDRIRSIGEGSSQIILGFWKDNKLIKITGSTYGKGIEISYGPENSPTNAKIISQDDSSEFTATDIETLYKTVDNYIYCKYIRRLPVIFDGVSYAIFTNYFNQDIQEYFIKNEMCEIYE